MEKITTFSDAIAKLDLNAEDQSEVIKNAGITPQSVISSTQFKSYVVLGITPEEFSDSYAAVEFDYDELRATFADYCKDFLQPLDEKTPSKALEFCSKILFEVGPNLRNEKKTKGDKMVRFNFCYVKTTNSAKSLSIKTVIVSTFRENSYVTKIEDKKMILTFKQAGMLAMDIFVSVIKYVYTRKQLIMMTPLCGAIFSRDCVGPIAEKLRYDHTKVISMINASTCSGGQYLNESDMACAIVAAICATKRVTNKGARDMIITKIVKQYSAKHKQFLPHHFDIFSEYALGGVPPGMDANSLIENYNNIQVAAVNRRVAAIAAKETLAESVSVDAGLSRPPGASHAKFGKQ